MQRVELELGRYRTGRVEEEESSQREVMLGTTESEDSE